MIHAPQRSPSLFGALVLALALTASTAFAQGAPEGVWQGVLGPDVIDLEIVVELATVDGALSGTIDIPAQSLFDFALGDVALNDDQISFTMPGVGGDPAFAGTLAGDRIEGTFTQGGQALPFFLERAAADAPSARPQEPVPPFPYQAEEVSFASGDVVLAGTLTVPPGDGPFPGVLFITGSGPQDRDETILGHKPFLVLADHLTRAGFATLRVDDRGVGGSSGDDGQASYDELLGDVIAGMETLAAHPRVDPERVGLLGHSQGGFLAPAAAVTRGDVAFVVLLAGPAVDGLATLMAQNRLIVAQTMRAQDPTVSDAVVEAAVADQVAFLEALAPLLAAGDVEGARALIRDRIEAELARLPEADRPDAATTEEIVAAQQAGVTSPAFRAFLAFDPQPYLERLTVPTLAVFGGRDLQVPADQSAGPMREALAAAGNPDFSVVTFPGLNHLMQPAVTGGLDEYGTITTTIEPILLETISDWLVARFGSR